MAYKTENIYDVNGDNLAVPVVDVTSDSSYKTIQNKDVEGNLLAIPVTQIGGGGGGVETDPIYTADKPNLATKEYTNTTFLPTTELPNVLAHTEVSSLADVNFDKSRSTFQLPFLNPITNMLEGVDLISEALDYNNILAHPLPGALAYGANDIPMNLTPEDIHGTIFEVESTGVRIKQPTNGISLSARLKLIGEGIDVSHALYVSIELLQNNVVIAERGTTLTSNTPLTSILDSVNINANVNDLIHVRVSYYDNGNHSKVSLDGTGYIQLYNANENAIKLPNTHLQSKYYKNGTITNLALTTTNQQILSTTIAEAISIEPHGISSRLDVTRTGGGNDGIVYFTLLKNGVALGSEMKKTLGSNDVDTIDPYNVLMYDFSANDTLSIQARYTGSGTASISNGVYSILGFKL